MFKKSLAGLSWTPIIILGLFWICTDKAYAQVVINEVLPNPAGVDDGAEWVELYNTGSVVTPLKNCVLYLHATNNTQKVEFTDEDFVEKFKVISWDGSWLNNSGDTVRFVCESASESISYGDAVGSSVTKPGEGISFGRTPDGSGTVEVLSSLTVGVANSSPPTNTPKPTSLPPSPKPTLTSVPAKNSPTPATKEIFRDSKTTPDNSHVSTVSAPQVPTEQTATVAGSETEPELISEDGSSREAQVLSASSKHFPLLAYILFISGFIILSFFLFTVILKFKKRYNSSDTDES